ncbi:MAG: response regulator transcription factor [Firmicutes bacterium]|nr:response regulator transcription factor [Bacillota bacterium]
MAPIRVLVVDDHPLFRTGVSHSLRQDHELQPVGEASNAREALALAKELLPDVILLDLKLGKESGLDLASDLQRECPICKVIVLTVYEDENLLLEALKRGANGYLVKGISTAELTSAVKAIAAGEAYITPRLAGRVLTEMKSRFPLPGPAAGLSEREEQILRLVTEGMTNREIADKLFLSERTIKHYITNILTKLQVRNRLEAALVYKEQKGLNPPPYQPR